MTPPVAPTLHPEIAAYLVRHRETVATHKRSLHDQIAAIHRVAAEARHLAVDLRTDLNEAEYAAHHDGLDNRYNFMHTRIDELDQGARDLEAALKRVAKAIRAIEDGHEADHDSLARIIDSNPRG